MLERLNNLPCGLDGLNAVGMVSGDDSEQVLEPTIESARRDGRRLRFLYRFGPSFEGFTPGGAVAWVRRDGDLARQRVARRAL